MYNTNYNERDCEDTIQFLKNYGLTKGFNVIVANGSNSPTHYYIYKKGLRLRHKETHPDMSETYYAYDYRTEDVIPAIDEFLAGNPDYIFEGKETCKETPSAYKWRAVKINPGYFDTEETVKDLQDYAQSKGFTIIQLKENPALGYSQYFITRDLNFLAHGYDDHSNAVYFGGEVKEAIDRFLHGDPHFRMAKMCPSGWLMP